MSDTEVCRLCLREDSGFTPIFASESEDDPSIIIPLAKRIMSFAQIKIAKGDGLPNSICDECASQVDNVYQFKLLCEKTDKTLRKSLSTEDKSGGFLSVRKDLHTTNQSSTEEMSERTDPEIEDRERPTAGDSESVDCWEVLKFTPEVIINEEDSRGSMDADNNRDFNQFKSRNGKHAERGGDKHSPPVQPSMMDHQLYQLSQVEAILRNHGTEIKVQGQPITERRDSAGSGSGCTTGVNGHAAQLALTATAVLAANAVKENGAQDYFPMYGVEAILNNGDAGNNGRSRRSRDGEKLFKCRLCPKSYSFSSALSRHKAVHNTQLRPHVCPICKKGFAELEKLERHSRTHLVDRTWRCDHCGRIFKAYNTYERHITTICSYRSRKENTTNQLLYPGDNKAAAALVFRNS